MPQQSVAQLQDHYDELMQQMTQLPLAILPASMASLLHFDGSNDAAAAAAAAAQHALPGVHTRCQACSSHCSQLLPLLSPRLDWHKRVVDVTSGVRFVCGQCAAVSSPSLLLQLATPLAAAHGPERAEQLQALLLHLAAINNAPASITSNADALAVWVQELACRALSLSVIASSLRGWQLQPAHTSAAQLLKHTPAPLSSGKQELKRKRNAAAGVVSPAAQQPQQGAAAVKRKSLGGAAAAAAAGAGGPGSAAAAPSTAQKQKRGRAPDHPVTPHSSKKSAKQQQPLAAKTPKLSNAAVAAPGGGGAAAFKTPQPGKVAKSASKQHKLLSTPR
jgi:hypothetical protein